MGNFPLTRIALNLSLIVALALQPVMAFAIPVVFASSCPALVGHTACGCCQIEQAAAPSCCCASAQPNPAPEITEGCCSREALTANHVSAAPKVHRFVESADSESTMRSRCRCLHESEPLSDTSRQRPVVEARPNVAIGGDGFLGTDWDSRLVATIGTGVDRDVSQLPHFSQVFLCIWRL